MHSIGLFQFWFNTGSTLQYSMHCIVWQKLVWGFLGRGEEKIIKDNLMWNSHLLQDPTQTSITEYQCSDSYIVSTPKKQKFTFALGCRNFPRMLASSKDFTFPIKSSKIHIRMLIQYKLGEFIAHYIVITILKTEWFLCVSVYIHNNGVYH